MCKIMLISASIRVSATVQAQGMLLGGADGLEIENAGADHRPLPGTEHARKLLSLPCRLRA